LNLGQIVSLLGARRDPIRRTPARIAAAIKTDTQAERRGKTARVVAGHPADFTIRRGDDGWYVHFAMKQYGPYPKARAIAGAIKTAKFAEQARRAARVREELGPFRWKTHWPKPKASGQSRGRSQG
jgi:hypothetical protein